MNFAAHKQFFCILGLAILSLNCVNREKKNDTMSQQIISWFLASGSNSSCVEYYIQENLCLKTPVAISEKCSNAELGRFQNGIQPTNLQTREVLEELLHCWSKCNSGFYLNYSSSGSCSFETEADYVNAKRSTNSGLLWRQCQSNCNTGADTAYPKLHGISTTTTYWPYP
ncbi:hypothetical protein AB3N59_15635 [Leptospira sp. WS92.C1]